MINTLKRLFGIGPSVDFAELIRNGGQIIDVRTKGEYAGGHIKGSINIPLNELKANLNKIKKDKPVITCCASGMRSATAKGTLLGSGYGEVYNGGSWVDLQSKI